jgi:sterol desaturase/sphingolipid hydroxylase (fatty acid hydroxylase superfamily)
MYEFILSHEESNRLGAFFCVFLLVAIWELIAPRKTLTVSKVVRWYSNLGITVINTFLLRLFFPIMAVGMANLAQERQWGLMNHIDVPFWPVVFLSVVVLDFIVYLQHVMFHQVPIFWCLHRMHHTDLNIDVTTGSRFHPIEIFISMVIKVGVVIGLGIPPVAVVIFEVFLNVMAMFNHGNIYIPSGIDRVLRWLVVTPDMHRIHHSVLPQETYSNYGFNISLWDRLFGTYCHQPQNGHDRMDIGIEIFRNTKFLNLHWLLIQPFLNSKKYN